MVFSLFSFAPFVLPQHCPCKIKPSLAGQPDGCWGPVLAASCLSRYNFDMRDFSRVFLS